ncbi:RimK-like protein, partial [Candidatus Poribacteria bacterium]|nr:RimK-like protein [Candidatus Poribacteria bacterium]
MNPRVLVLSGLYDFSSDLVSLELKKIGVSYLRLNREQLSQHRLTLDPTVPELTIDGPAGNHRVDLSLDSVFFRQPVFLRNTPGTPIPPEDQLERSQWMAFLRSLCVFKHARWMNNPTATYLAESKPYQLFAASKCGFKVPKTLATNDAIQIQNNFPESLVIKSLDTVLLRDGDDCLFTYTTILSSLELTEEEVSTAPLLAQTALKDKIDLRVTVVGDDIFSVRILSKGSGIPGDWRIIPKEILEYEDIVLDEETTKSCHQLIKELGLDFAAIDLIETSDGIYFIEINPTGEWGWLSNT